MCGIVGVIGNPKAAEIILTGLGRLEYRGYDSSGLAVLNNLGTLEVHKAVGKLQSLLDKVKATPPSAASIGIGHTRWATHGSPTEENAHPHTGRLGGVNLAVVHNGIIENYQELRAELSPHGAVFRTETDTETIPFAIANALEYGGGHFIPAVRAATQKFRGNFAFVTLKEGDTTQLVGTRRGAPLCIGVGTGANYFASDPFALAGVTSKFIFLEDDDIATLTPTSITIQDAKGNPVTRPTKTLDLSEDMAGKAGYKHFMLKEIHEQPAVVTRILQAYTSAKTMQPTLPLEGLNLAEIPFINIIACGTASYAGMLGKYFLEQFARVPVNVDVASEFRYRNPPFPPGGIFIGVSQSGETADTLAALEIAKAAGQKIIVFTNAPNSSMARAADVVVDLMAGREIAVASTKAFTAMCLNLALFALQVGAARGLPVAEVATQITALRTLPTYLTNQLNQPPAQFEELAERLTAARSMLYLGRGTLTPIAFEGALKIKEISYIHAAAYASGEMKHGPIALVDKTLPVINLASGTDGLFEKTVSNLKEVEARHGQVILVTDDEGAKQLDDATRSKLTLIKVPTVPPILAPMVFTVPLQLLAYHTATAKGTDVDQPRNLAKSVTVE
ncbi:MAG: glutamine--fructose-6-phosphate transaminase (isomerizing) [Proteobacteria bacterium]|nr:glutamine--fructose-6-phosphate transaminase (isomerizing) [Pseudomonadota bacterium]